MILRLDDYGMKRPMQKKADTPMIIPVKFIYTHS